MASARIMSSIIHGLVGAVIATALTAYVAKQVGKAAAPGQLRYGPFLWVVGLASFAFALLPVAMTIFLGHDRDFWAKMALFVGFGVGAVYCLAEVAFVGGSFDEHGIVFSTPWTGVKRERWADLDSIEVNSSCCWYTLTFRSGKKIRLSFYLGGHADALERAAAQLDGTPRGPCQQADGASDGTRTHNPRDHNPVL